MTRVAAWDTVVVGRVELDTEMVGEKVEESAPALGNL